MYSSLAVQLNDSVEKWPIVSTSYDEIHERLTYKLKDPLPTDAKATLIIRFSGDLTESRAGYYRSTWAHDGTVEHYSLTKFEVQLNAHLEILRIISFKKISGYLSAQSFSLLGRAFVQSNF